MRIDDVREMRLTFVYVFQSVLASATQRIDDVREMCEKRRGSLKRLVERPVQLVAPVRPQPPTGQEEPLHSQVTHIILFWF